MAGLSESPEEVGSAHRLMVNRAPPTFLFNPASAIRGRWASKAIGFWCSFDFKTGRLVALGLHRSYQPDVGLFNRMWLATDQVTQYYNKATCSSRWPAHGDPRCRPWRSVQPECTFWCRLIFRSTPLRIQITFSFSQPERRSLCGDDVAI